jgi:hypothetical protein
LTAVVLILAASTFDLNFSAFALFIAVAFFFVYCTWPDEVNLPEISDYRLTAIVESLAEIAKSERGM